MRQVAIVEDDVDQGQIVARQIEHSPYSGDLSVRCFESLSSFESSLEQTGSAFPDILVMEIAFADGDHDGIEAVKRFAPTGCGTQVIYLASLAKYCTKVYQTEHTYLLTKPVVQSDLNAALAKALAALNAAANRPVGLLSNGTLFVLHPRKIVYIESDGHKVHIHQNGGIIEAYASLTDIERRLPPSFVRCHKSFLVNMNYIVELQKTDVRLATGEVIPLSQRRRPIVRDALVAYLRADGRKFALYGNSHGFL